MKSPLRNIALALVTVASLASVAAAQRGPSGGDVQPPPHFGGGGGPGRGGPPPFGPGGMHGPGMDCDGPPFGLPREVMEQLGLTDAQREKLADIHERQAAKAIPLEADVRLAELELHKLLRADQPNMAEVGEKVDRISGLRGQLMKLHLAGMIESRSALTPAQRKKLRDLRPEGPPPPMR